MGKRKIIGFAAAFLVLAAVGVWRCYPPIIICRVSALALLVQGAERSYVAEFGRGPADLRWAQPQLDRLCQGAATISTADGEIFVVQLHAGRRHQRVEFRRIQSEDPHDYRYLPLER